MTYTWVCFPLCRLINGVENRDFLTFHIMPNFISPLGCCGSPTKLWLHFPGLFIDWRWGLGGAFLLVKFFRWKISLKTFFLVKWTYYPPIGPQHIFLKFCNKSSLALRRTSAGSVWCFWGMFSTIHGSRKSKCVSTFLSQNTMHLQWKIYSKERWQ